MVSDLTLLLVSLILFYMGIVPIAQYNNKSPYRLRLAALISAGFILYLFIFLMADYITGNGVDRSFSYFIFDSFTGISFIALGLKVLLILIIATVLFFLFYRYHKRYFIKTKPWNFTNQNLAGLLIILSFALSPVTVGLIKNYVFDNPQQTSEERHEVNRFIAHAGGSIEGNIYTNSLEALNRSYLKGFRLFELDIRKTSDDVYVAVHDWEQWKTMTNYKGALPPTQDEFKHQKILGKYTPLDLSDINVWFRHHEDAILVSDKVNDPLHFSNQFTDSKRLMMELFTLESVTEAAELDIKSSMPNWDLVKQMDDKIETLLELGITDVAASRQVVKHNIPLLQKLKENGIRVYVYHVNHNPTKDEPYVFCNDMNYVYGMYADDFDFEIKINCD